MGDDQAVAGEADQTERAEEATAEGIKAGDSGGEGEGEKEEPRRSPRLNLKDGAALIKMVQLLGPDSWLGEEEG